MTARKGLTRVLTKLMTAATVMLVSGSAVIAAEGGAAPTGQLILDEGSPWRMFAAWNTPVIRKGPELTLERDSGSRGYFAARTPPPPAEWAQPAFPDGSWSRWSLSRKRRREYDYGFAPAWGAPGPTLSLLCLRGKFAVEDPAKVRNLRLSMAYRGGVVVYVNGQEVARASLPKEGKVLPDALADDYPPEAFHLPAAWRRSLCIRAEFGHPRQHKDRLEKRIRGLGDVTIDSKVLRKGINVLAVEIHRAPYFGNGLAMEGLNHESVWSTAGLVSLALRAEGGVEPNTRRPEGIHVWACSDMRRPSPLDYGNPLGEPGPVRIVGCLNGAFDGKVMVSSDKPLTGVRARVSDMRHTDGKAPIPASAVTLLYTVRDDALAMRYRVPGGGFWDSLSESPPAKVEVVAGMGACQAILLKVRVPADAAPGDYTGTLTVSANGLQPVEVPVHLRVIGWRLPDPKDFATHMGIIQSPISGDARAPTKEMMENLRAVMPEARWVANPHGDVRGRNMHGMPIGYNTVYYMNLCPPPGTALARHGAVNGRFYGWQSKSDYYGRSRGPTAPLTLWRGSVEAALMHNCSGLGRIGADFWPVLLGTDWKSRRSRAVGKHSATVAARYPESSWDQLNLDRGTEALLAPGPRGAAPTERSEQVRQGIQECEARAFIEKAIVARKLDPELARKCQDVLDRRVWHIRGLGACGGAGGAALGGPMLNTWYQGAGYAGMAEKLFAAAAEVAGKLGAN